MYKMRGNIDDKINTNVVLGPSRQEANLLY